MDLDLLDSLDKSLAKLRELVEKTKLNDIYICYSNIKELNLIKQQFQNIPDRVFNSLGKSKDEIIKYIDEKVIPSNIEIIIKESYNTFMDIKEDETKDDELKKLVYDIQKSSFYEENKDRYKVKKMEIELIMVEAEKNKDYVKAKQKLIQIINFVKYLDLKDIIKEFIDICEHNCVIKEHHGISELVLQQNYGKAYEKYENLFNNYPNQLHLIYREYLSLLDNVIMKKIARNEIEIVEIEKYKNFINKYKDKIEDYKKEIKRIETFEKKKNWKNKENLKEKEEINKENEINILYNIRNEIKRSKESIDYYLNEIERNIDKKDLEEFKKTKLYIYEQIANYEKEERNNFSKSRFWVSNRKKSRKSQNELLKEKNVGAIYSYFNYLNKKETHFDIRTIQLISLLLLSKKLPNKLKGIYCKINTGEGKSTIILFFAAYKVLLGNKVDIITSNQLLAERDANKDVNVKFYKKLNIKSGALKDEDTDYNLDVIYGDSTNFSADILKQDFEFVQTRKNRGYDVVIIDEVDSMCIDNLATKTQLTKNFPGYQSLYTFYYTIILTFCFIADKMKLTNDKYEINKKREIIKNAIIKRLKDIIIFQKVSRSSITTIIFDQIFMKIENLKQI